MTIHGGLNTALDYTNWVVPERADEFNRAIDWLLNGRERYRVTATRGMLAEFLTQEKPGRALIHLVNLRPEPQRGCRVSLPPRTQVQVLHPPTDTAPQWRVVQDEQARQVVFDRLDTYAIIVAADA